MLRAAAPGLAAAVLCASLAGADGLASLVLLAAIVAAAARLLEAVGLAAERRGDRASVVTVAAGLVCLVAAGAMHAPLLVLGLFACAGLELLGSSATAGDAVPEPAELVESTVSRAA